MSPNQIELNWSKAEGGLLPAVIQDAATGQVLMLGYMNPESLAETEKTGKVTFYSRSRKRLWMKGESSGHVLNVVSLEADCDQDAILVRARPEGPTCHRDTVSCFGDGAARGAPAFLSELERIIDERFRTRPEGSYVAKLLARGPDRIAQKVGEEAVETVIASKNPDQETFESEAADLLFHLMLLLKTRGSSLGHLAKVLEKRHASR